LFDPDLMKIELEATSRNDVLIEVVSMLGLDKASEEQLYKILLERQELVSTGIGQGLAFIEERIPFVDRLRLGYARKSEGIDFKALDDKPVYHFFLVFAPDFAGVREMAEPLVRLSAITKEPEFLEQLSKVETLEEFLELIDSKDK